MTYAIIDGSHTVINIIRWDGASEYDPGEGNSLVVVPDDIQIEVGWTYTDGVFLPLA